MVALGVDYGYLLKVRTDLQRVADAAALAAVQDLLPADNGAQDLAAVRARIRSYVAQNVDGPLVVLDSDIEIGRYDPSTVYSNVTLLDWGIYDAVRVTLRRDGQANSPVSLFFAKVFGTRDADVTVTATAVLQKPTIVEPGADVLPFGMPLNIWEMHEPDEVWTVYGDGKLVDSNGDEIPGNWGTIDIGAAGNSTSDLGDQMLNGLRQSDVDALYADNRIPRETHIESDETVWMNADTGISSGMKSAVQAIHGLKRIVPIYDTLTGESGNNLEFRVVGWGVVIVDGSHWGGEPHTWVNVKKSFTYDGELRPQPDLSNTVGVIEGAFTSPVLVE
jgi:hypothetical protein